MSRWSPTARKELAKLIFVGCAVVNFALGMLFPDHGDVSSWVWYGVGVPLSVVTLAAATTWADLARRARSQTRLESAAAS